MATMVRFLLLCVGLLSAGAMAQTLTFDSQFNQYQKFTPVTPQFAGFLRAMRSDIHEASGKQVYVWTEPDVSGSLNRDVYCAILDKDMNILVNAFRVNNITTNQQYFQNVQIHQSDNSFVVVWGGTQSGNWDIYAKKIRLDITDAQTATEVTNVPDLMVNASTTGDQYYPAFVINTRSNEVIVGFTTTGVNGTKEVNYQRLNMNPPGTALTRVTGSADQQVNTVVAGDQGIGIAIDYIQSTGQTIFTYHSKNPALTYDILSRALNYDDVTGAYSLNTEITVNTYTTGDQQNPHIKVNQETGQYAICWQSLNQTASSGWDAYARIFNASNIEVKSEFVIGSAAAQSQGQTYPKAVWDEYSNVLSFYFLNYSNPNSVIKARMFDGNNAYAATTTGDLDPLNGLNITNNVYGYWWPMIHQKSHNLYLTFDILNAGSVDSYSRVAKFKYSHPSFNPSLSANNGTMNWTDTKTFNAYGDVVSESRIFYDNRGKELQSQSFNAENPKTVFAQMPLYDYLDRPAIQTLPGVVNSSGTFAYNPYFASVNFSPSWGPTKLETYMWDGATTVMNPTAMVGSFGVASYYNSTNTLETGVPNTSYPYSRTFFNDAAPGGVIKQAGPGDALRMGQGHEVKSINLPVLSELNHYAKQRSSYLNSSFVSIFNNRAMKQIVIDENGMNSVVFTDLSGNTIATAKANDNATAILSGFGLLPNYYSANIFYNPHAPSTRGEYLQLFGSGNIEVFNSSTHALLFSGTIEDFQIDLNTNIGGKYNIQNLHIRSNQFFRVKLHYSGGVDFWSNIKSKYDAGICGMDVHLQNNHNLRLAYANLATGVTIKIQDLTTGAEVYSGSLNGYSYSTLPPGFYRFIYAGLNYDGANDYNYNYQLLFEFNQYYDNWAYYIYDDAGRMVAKTAPNGITSLTNNNPSPFTDKFSYSTTGQQLSSTTVDGGTINYVYTKDGKIRFSQNADQATDGRFSFVNYDSDDRIVLTGEYKKNLEGAPLTFMTQKEFDNAGSPENTVISIVNKSQGTNVENGGLVSLSYLTDYKKIEYSTTNIYNLVNSGGDTRQSRNVWNRASLTFNKAGYTTAYSYDNEGNLEWMAQTLPGLGSKTIDYVFDDNHNLLQSIYQKNDQSDRFSHIYTYDKIGRLKTASTRESNGMVKLQEKYIYYLHGPLKRKELAGNLQGIDYVYTIQGWLKGINHPELNTAKDPGKDGASGTPNAGFAPDVFGMGLDYYNGDYSNSAVSYASPTGIYMFSCGLNSLANTLQGNMYNGTIRSMIWLTSANLTTNPNQCNYNYDNKYQLTAASFGNQVLSNYNNYVPDVNSKYSTMVSYDPNGNLTGKFTWKTENPEVFTYNLTANTNKLASVYMPAGATREYTYNAVGQMINQTDGTSQKKLTYDANGLVTAVRDASNLLRIAFEYNERGKRVKKISYATNGSYTTTWYVCDATGNELSIYDTKSTPTPVQTEVPIYGSSRIGMYTKSYSPVGPYALTGTNMVYELKDHLGNVRATINRTKVGNVAQVSSWADYYPFGEVMNSWPSDPASKYRYGYQGDYAECDDETKTGALTGWNNFDLRMYDASIGRWLTTDPYGQYHSPYVGMGNNPISIVDPNGGEGKDWGEITNADGSKTLRWFGEGVKVPEGWKTVSTDYNYFTENYIQHPAKGSPVYHIEFAPGTMTHKYIINDSDSEVRFTADANLKIDYYAKSNLDIPYISSVQVDVNTVYTVPPHTTSYIPVDFLYVGHLNKNAVYKVVNGNSVTITNTSISDSYHGVKSFLVQNAPWIPGNNYPGGWYSTGHPLYNSYERLVTP